MLHPSIKTIFLVSLVFSFNLFSSAAKKYAGKKKPAQKAKTAPKTTAPKKRNANANAKAETEAVVFDPEYARRAMAFYFADMYGTIAEEIEIALKEVKEKHMRLRQDASLNQLQYDQLQAQALKQCEEAIEKCKMLEKRDPRFAAKYVGIFKILKHQCTPLGFLKIIEERIGDAEKKNNAEQCTVSQANEQCAGDVTRALVQGKDDAKALLQRFQDNPQEMRKCNQKRWTPLMVLAAQGHGQLLEDCLKIIVEQDYKKQNEVYKKLPLDFVTIITFDKPIGRDAWNEFDVLREPAAAYGVGAGNQAHNQAMPTAKAAQAAGSQPAAAAPVAALQYPYLPSRHHFANSEWFRPFMCQHYLMVREEAETMKREMHHERPSAAVLTGLEAYLFVKDLHANAQDNPDIVALDSTADKEKFQRNHAEYQRGLRALLDESLNVKQQKLPASGAAAARAVGIPTELISSFLETDCPQVPRLAMPQANVAAAAKAKVN